MDQTQIESEIKYLKDMVKIQSTRIDNMESAYRLLTENYKTLLSVHSRALEKHEEIADKNTELISSIAKDAIQATEELRKYLEGNKPMEVVK